MILSAILACALSSPMAATASLSTSPVIGNAKSSAARPGASAAVKDRSKAPRSKPASPPLRRVAVANAAATIEPASTGFINAIQVYPFVEGKLYRLFASPERVTDITLQPGEGLISVAAGDTARWVIGDTASGSDSAKRTHILVKPFGAGLTTNLVITTDRRSYHLDLTSTAGPAMAALSWTYPQDELIALRRATAAAEKTTPVAAALAVEQLHFNYVISGDEPSWRPLRAFDNGRQTFIEFPASIVIGEAPPLFVIEGKGDAALVNYRLSGRFYVVDRIFDEAELRLGTKKQQIVRILRVAEGAGRGRGS